MFSVLTSHIPTIRLRPFFRSLEDAQAELEIMKSQENTEDADGRTNCRRDQLDDERVASDHRRDPLRQKQMSMEDSIAPPAPPLEPKDKDKSGLNTLFNLLVNGPCGSACGSDKNTQAIVSDETENTNNADNESFITPAANTNAPEGINRGLIPTPPLTPTHSITDEKWQSDVLGSTNTAAHGTTEPELHAADTTNLSKERRPTNLTKERRQHDSYIQYEKYEKQIAAEATVTYTASPPADLRLRPLEQRAQQEAPSQSLRSPSTSAEPIRGRTTEIHRMARSGEWQTLRQALTATASSEYRFTVSAASQPDENCRTPLMLACRHGSSFPSDVARLLLVANNQSASKFVVQSNGGEQTCLHVAATAGCNLEVLETLLAGAPASIHVADENGNMPLHAAVNNGRYRCATAEANEAGSSLPQDIVFQSKKADLGNIFDVIDEASTYDEENSVGAGSSTFLGSATGFESHIDLVDACELLIKSYPGALVHRNRRGETPLILAMYRRASADVVSLLLRNGGPQSVQISDGFGSLPLHFCDRAPSLKIVSEMVSLHPEGTMCLNEMYEETPLYSAMLGSCDPAVLKILLDACPEPKLAVNYLNKQGKSAIEFGWDILFTPCIVAAEDQDEEDARIDKSKTLVESATSIEDIRGTHVAKWWEKGSLLLQASYHNSTHLDEKNGLIGEKTWSPCHAAAGIVCPIDMFKFVLQLHTEDVTSADEYGNTPYHICALRSSETPKEVLYTVINTGPSDAAFIQNQDGNTPLHLAILFGASAGMIQIMLATGTKAACIKNNAGLTPLALALAYGTPIATLRLILKACPEAVDVRDNNETSTIQFAWDLMIAGAKVEESVTESSFQEHNQTDQSASNINTLALCARSSGLVGDSRLWMGKIDLLLRAAFHGVAENRSIPNKRKWRAVHAACNGGTCPFDVLAFSLQILPGETKVFNEAGSLPLHIASSAPPYETTVPPELAPGRPIHLLLNRSPEGAMKVNKKGRLPLHLALESGKTLDNGVEALVEAFPESVRMRDPVTLLYPFQMAAVKRNNSDEVDLAITNAMFILLLEAPELVTTNKGNAELHYAKRRNTELLDEVHQLKQQRTEVEEELQSRMTRLEVKEIEDMKKMEKNRKKEEECRARAAYLVQNSLQVSSQLSSLAIDIAQTKAATETYNKT